MPVILACSALLVVGLAACAPASSDTRASQTPTATATASASADPSRPSAPAAVVLTCENVLDPASVSAFAAEGFTQTHDFAQRSIDEGWPEAAFVTNGGLLCQWGYPNSDASEYYGLSEISAEHTATITARLVAEGFTREPHSDGEMFVSPPTEGVNIHYFFADEHWFVGFSPERVDEIRRNAGLG